MGRHAYVSDVYVSQPKGKALLTGRKDAAFKQTLQYIANPSEGLLGECTKL
ncbi:hypothetical protein PRVXT_000604 [Proteinivorax tanatarense]|uniref:Uncharacterized protein n=1 Tax=Proteinivorax tanatarense TaxID=1260629 RepID=A0AAU7VN39_9FIRM